MSTHGELFSIPSYSSKDPGLLYQNYLNALTITTADNGIIGLFRRAKEITLDKANILGLGDECMRTQSIPISDPCERLSSILLQAHKLINEPRPYSLCSVISGASQDLGRLPAELDDFRPRLQELYTQLDLRLGIMTNYIYLLAESIKILGRTKGEILPDDLKLLVNNAKLALRYISKEVEEFVKKGIRTISWCTDSVYDSYNLFRERWNKLVGELDVIYTMYLGEHGDIWWDLQIPELGVVPKPARTG